MIFIGSCGNPTKHPNTPEVLPIPETKLKLTTLHFERDLFSYETIDSNAVIALRSKYGDFFDLWCIRLAGVIPGFKGAPDNKFIAFNLNQYVHDKYIKDIHKMALKQFPNTTDLEEKMTLAFKRYHSYFPNKTIPKLVTYIAPFNSNVTTLDSVLGIGLHFYFESDYQYYPSLDLPQYMVRKFEKEYMVTDLMRGWLDSEYLNDTVQRSFLNHMIYEGKIMYALELIIPEEDDTLKIGYTANQLEWSYENEERTWGFFIEQKLLFSNNAKYYMKYINDGNGTSGFPENAPAKTGVFIGWQIVRSYMKNNKEITLEQLLNNQNGQDILSKSGYKPTKVKS
jgi:hypothetical protein